MKIDYEAHYDKAYWTFSKEYRTPDGQTRQYVNPSLDWEGWDPISVAMRRVLPAPPAALLDIGCGGAGLTERFRIAKYEAFGVDVSEHAVNNAVVGMRGRIALADISQAPTTLKTPTGVILPNEFDVVMATDLMEHLYETDLDNTFDWMMSKTAEDGFLFLLIATTAPGEREFVLQPGQEVPLEYEATAIAGHVNVRSYWGYWIPFFRRKGLKIRWDLMYLFQSLRCDIDWWAKLIQWGHRGVVVLQKP